MRRIVQLAMVAALTLGLVAGAAGGAQASFPGQDTVAFVRYNGTNTRIIEMRPNGTEQHRIVGPDGGLAFYGAAMSPDGRFVVFPMVVDEQTDLFVRRLGGRTDQITDTPGRNEYSPMWTPDGDRVVFMETDEVTYSAIVLRDADGTRRREIDRSDQAYLLYPSISPNGSRVLYSAPGSSTEPGRGKGNPYDLVTRRLDGTGRRWVTDTPNASEIAGDWAPDGERVAYLLEPELKPRPIGAVVEAGAARGMARGAPVYSVRSEGGGRRLVSDKPGINGRVIYTPDGTRVIFSRFTSDSFDLFSTPVGGGVLKRLTETLETYNTVDLFRVLPT